MSYDTGGFDFFTAQPQEWWKESRAGCPVIRTESSIEAGPNYQITRFTDAEHALRDWETFSSSINGEQIGRYMGELILAMNGKEHRQYRNLVAKAFRASVLERWDAELVTPVIEGPRVEKIT